MTGPTRDGAADRRFIARGGLVALLAVSACAPKLQREDVDRAVTLSRAGEQQAAEQSLRTLLVPRAQGQQLAAEDTLHVRSRLVSVLENQDRLGEAVQLAQQVHQEWRELRGERAPNTIAALANLGRLYASIGRLTQAIEAQERSTRSAIEVLGSWHEVSVAARNNLAATYMRIGRIDEAVRLQESALAASRRTRGDRDLQTLLAQSNLSRSYLAAGRLEPARASSDAALSALRETVGPDSPLTLAAAAQQVSVLQALGRLDTAAPAQEHLVQAALRTWGERHRFTLEQLSTLARLRAAGGRVDEALDLSRRFVDGAERVRGQPGLSRDDRRALFSTYADDYRFFSALHGRQGRLPEGFKLAELSKARTLLESMSEQAASRSRVLPAAEQAALQAMEQSLQALETAVSEAADARSRAARLQERDAELRRYEALVGELKGKHPKFAQLRDPRVVEPADLPGLLAPGSMFVGYVVRQDQVSVWLTDEAGQLAFVELGAVPRLADSIEAQRRLSSLPGGMRQLERDEGLRVWHFASGGYALLPVAAAPPPGAQLLLREAELTAFLSDRLVAPLAARLRGKSRWVVSPDGPLAQLAFELLSVEGQRLLDKADVQYVQSLSVYKAARARQDEYRGRVRPKHMFAMGNPDYEVDAGATPAGMRSRLRSQPVYADNQLRELRGLWTSLPASEDEVKRLQRLMPASDVHLQRAASETTLLQAQSSGALRHYRYLHFAVHGYLSTNDPSLSSIVLSQSGLGPGTDGYVTAAEWPAYDIASDLTVLSACDTGLGHNISGEGVMGLPYALFVAGNVNTMLTLWPVFDDVAPAMMEKFFRRLLSGQDATASLAATKREMAAHPKTRHPAYWAPFILVGAG